jgi:hypothetical protein
LLFHHAFRSGPVVQGAVFQGLVDRGTVFQCRRIHDADAMSIMATLRCIDMSYPFWTRHATEDFLVRQNAETSNG